MPPRTPSSTRRRTRRALRRLGCVALFFRLAAPVAAQPTWTGSYGGPDADLGYGAAVAADGGVIAVGFRGEGNPLSGYAVRTDAVGGVLWERILSLSPLTESMYDVVPAGDGGWILIGSADLEGTPDWRPWLVKLDDDGNVEWETSAGLTQTVEVDSAIVVGDRLADGRFVAAGGSNTMVNPEDPWVALVDGHGSLLAFAQYPSLGPSEDGFEPQTYVLDVAATEDGGFVLAGTVGPGIGTAFVWRFDSEGRPVWDRLYGDLFFRTAEAVRPIDGGYLITGCAQANCDRTAIAEVDALGEPVWSTIVEDPSGRRSIGRDVVALDGGGSLVLQSLDEAAGSTVFQSELMELDAAGTVIAVSDVAVGTISTQLRALTVGVGRRVAAGLSNDTSDPNAIDLALAVFDFEGSGAGVIFDDGFETGDASSWSSVVP